MSKREEILKKRLYGDALCAWVMAVFMLLGALSKVFTALTGFVNVGMMKGSLEGSPALVLGDGIRQLLLAAAIVLLALILTSIRKEGRPFTKMNVSKFRLMAILIIICAVINLIVSSIAGFFDPQAAFQLTFGVSDFVYAVIGAIFGIISEIFYYGYELQEEMDSIV